MWLKQFKSWLALGFMIFVINSYAALNYETYASSGSSPAINSSALLTTGTVPNINFYWGGGSILDTGRPDGVIIRFYGFYVVPGTGTQNYQFGLNADDGVRLRINNQLIIDFWGDQGSTFRNGNITLTGGSIVPIEIDFYENGGGAELQLYWYNGSWQIVPPEHLSINDPSGGANNQNSLCCGGSAIPFSQNSTFANKVATFAQRPNQDSNIIINQIGNNNATTVIQSGTSNNYIEINMSGNNNIINANQTGNNITLSNYLELTITGSSNSIDITQTSSGGAKGITSQVNNNTNAITINQTDNGNHYAEISLSGGNKSVNLTQSGDAGHMAKIDLSGGATNISLTQSGSTQQFYSITHNCANISCATITVTQGQ